MAGHERLPAPARRFIFTVIVARFGAGLTLPYTLIFLHEVRHLSLPTVGALLAVPGFVGLVAVPVSGALVDRVGPRRVLAAAQLLQAAAVLVIAFATSPLAVLPGMVLLGLGLGPSFPAGAALLNGLVTGPDQMQRAFGLNFTALNAAIGTGALIASVVVDVDRAWSFIALFLGNAACAVVGAVLLPEGRLPEREEEKANRPSYREALADPLLRRICVVSLLLALAGYASLDSGVPAFARVEGGIDPSVIGLVFVVNTVTIVSLQLLFLRLLSGRRRSTALAATGVLWALSWGLLGLVSVGSETSRLTALLVFGGLFGVGEMLVAPTLQPMVNALATDRLRGRYNALSGLMFSICFVLAPAVSGVLIGNGLGRWWVVGMVAAALVAAVVSARLRSALTDEQDGLVSGLDAEGERRLEVVP
ncbi:MAG TPA: MFS transporter [Mycobacteriales bacterium]|nr:MFS transporter [Mycobacteriales bacterium]